MRPYRLSSRIGPFALIVLLAGVLATLSACHRKATDPEPSADPAPKPSGARGDPSTSPGPKPGPGEGTRYALLAGVNDYDHGNLQKLNYAVNDVAELADVLKGAGYSVTLLTGTNASRSKIEAALKELVTKFARGDTLLVGLAGHGLQLEGDDDSYFCPVDARPSKDRKDSLVSIRWVFDRLERDAASGVKLVLVDACRNDPKSGRGRGIDAATAPNPPKGVGVLLSCSAGETSWEHKSFGTGHGAFFHHVIEGLKGNAKDDEGNVTWDSLRAYVKRGVAREVPKVLQDGAQQTPEESGRLAGVPPVLIDGRFEIDPGTQRKVKAQLMCLSLSFAIKAYMLNPNNAGNDPPESLMDLVKPPFGGASYLKNDEADLIDPWGQKYRIEPFHRADGTVDYLVFTFVKETPSIRISQFGIGEASAPPR